MTTTLSNEEPTDYCTKCIQELCKVVGEAFTTLETDPLFFCDNSECPFAGLVTVYSKEKP